jgi:hypothetical protein
MALHTGNFNMCPVSRGMLVHVQEPSLLDVVRSALGGFHVKDIARCDIVAAFDDLVAANLHECDGFGVAGLETDAGPCGNVESEAVGSDTVKL